MSDQKYDTAPRSERDPKEIGFFDVFSGRNTTNERSVAYVFCPIETDEYSSIVLYAVDYPSRHSHPGILELGKYALEVIPEDIDEATLAGGRINPDRLTTGTSAAYKNSAPTEILAAFEDYLKDLDSKK